MKNAITSLLFIAGLILCGAPYATAQDQQEKHTLKDGEARTGSKFRDVLVRSGGEPCAQDYLFLMNFTVEP